MNGGSEQYQALRRQIDELGGRMAELMAKMTALCEGLRKEGIV